MSVCNMCPRMCNVDRKIKTGYCSMSENIKISRAALHAWEEPCISGEKGSGTVFFSGCNMKCVFCQNKEISTGGFGKEITVEKLAEIFLKLQDKGALNINLVTPTHYTAQIIQAVTIAKNNGLSLPIVYNTSCYENPQTIDLLDDIVDIYLPDFKYFDNDAAKKYSCAPDYVEMAKASLDRMVKQQPQCIFDDNGIMQKGVIVRHLVLPGQTEAAKDVIDYLYSRYGNSIFVSIMSQYTPCTDLSDYPEINRKLSLEEYDDVINFAIDIGLENGFVQDGESASESFIPPFDLEGVD